MVRRVLFWLAAACCLSPLVRLPDRLLALVAPGALIVGMTLALTLGNPYPGGSKRVSRVLLQAAVVLLGFSLELKKVLEAGVSGLGLALVSIAMVYGLGFLLSRLLAVRPVTSLLVSTGTAICGGSAIAAMATVVDAPQEDVSVSVGTVFLLNAVGLLLFPPLGHALALTNTQFGEWAGIAIHDVSSVVGAATSFGPGSLATATAVKLSRVLYLVPIVVVVAFARKSRAGESGGRARAPVPWFIGLFLIACLLRSFVPFVAAESNAIRLIAIAGFALSLFLIGGGISRKTLRAVGARPLLEGVVLWAAITVIALAAVKEA